MRVLALGSPWRGDDGVGPRVIDALRALDPDLDARALPGAEALVELLDGTPALLIDALLGGGPPGALLEPPLAALATGSRASSHGLGPVEAAGLAEALNGPTPLRVLAICIARAEPGEGLSPAVAAAVAPAAARALAITREPPHA